MTLVIGVGGRLTAGKDAFADHLVDQHGFVKLGMSDTLAEALYRLNPIVERGWDTSDYPIKRYQDLVDEVGYVEAKKNPEVRRLLQVLGTEVGRQLLGENIWVEAAKKKILEEAEAGRDVVITGIRYANELRMVEYLGSTTFDPGYVGTTVWVDRPGLESTGEHSSENSIGLKDFEYVFDNDGTLEELPGKADELLEVIRNDFL